MKLVTFGINDEMHLTIQFPVFIPPYIKKKQLILYQTEALPVPIIYLYEKSKLIYKLSLINPYTALNEETHIS